MSEDFQSLIANEVRRKKAAEEAFSQMSFEAFTYSPEAVNKVIGINKDLNRMVVGLDTHTALPVVRGYLNSLSLWKAKFTSGELGNPKEDTDSLYFLTPEGMSLRLKISNLTTGDIHKVIQPFAEYITFEDDNLHTSDAPNLGLTVQEYLSPAFKDLQYGPEINTPFTSEIRLYNHPNGSKVIRQGDGCFNHTGSRVNKILS